MSLIPWPLRVVFLVSLTIPPMEGLLSYSAPSMEGHLTLFPTPSKGLPCPLACILKGGFPDPLSIPFHEECPVLSLSPLISWRTP